MEKLPKKINVMGEEFTIRLVKNNKWVGEVDIFTRSILINSRVSKKIQKEALLHEVIEYMVYRLGMTQDSKKWRTIQMKHCRDNTPNDVDTFIIFVNTLTDTLVRNGFLK